MTRACRQGLEGWRSAKSDGGEEMGSGVSWCPGPWAVTASFQLGMEKASPAPLSSGSGAPWLPLKPCPFPRRRWPTHLLMASPHRAEVKGPALTTPRAGSPSSTPTCVTTELGTHHLSSSAPGEPQRAQHGKLCVAFAGALGGARPFSPWSRRLADFQLSKLSLAAGI